MKSKTNKLTITPEALRKLQNKKSKKKIVKAFKKIDKIIADFDGTYKGC